MAKKKENVLKSTSPLQAVTVGRFKDNRYGWVGILLLFALFGGTIYFLPELTGLYEEYMEESIQISNNTINNTTNMIVDTPQEKVPEKYVIYETKSVDLKEITVDNINIDNNILTYNIINNTNKDINLANLNYYIELYDSNNNATNIFYISDTLLKNETKNYSHSLKSNDIKSFSIYEILEDDYTYIDLEIDSNKTSTLTCVNNERTLSYIFQDEKLKQVKDTATYSMLEANYAIKYDYYNNLLTKFISSNGVSGSIEEFDNTMNYNLSIEYRSKILFNYIYYFEMDTSPREVYFKMNALEFKCS